MVIAENAFLLIAGTLIGAVCALIAIAPAFFERGGHLPESVARAVAARGPAGRNARVARRGASGRAGARCSKLCARSSDIILSKVCGTAAAACASYPQLHAAFAENWPQWRGPNLNSTSGETDLPVKWSPDENIAWKLPLPAGAARRRSSGAIACS